MPVIRGEWNRKNPDYIANDYSELRTLFSRYQNDVSDVEVSTTLSEALIRVGEAITTYEPHELHCWVDVLNFMETQFDIVLGIDNPSYCSIGYHKLAKDEISDDAGSEVEVPGGNKRAEERKIKNNKEKDGMEVDESIIVISDARKESDSILVKAMLSFTSRILRSTVNKEVYASTNHLLRLLRAYELDFVCLALKCLNR